jgi:diguanylate cyclase (GGDEF)-like protein
MTMLRQLAAVIITLFVLLFAGTILISANDARSYLNTQLKIVSQDTATSLGLSLSPHMAANEMAIVTSMTDAIFDSGYYREVSIRSVDGKTILKRLAPERIEGVPAWFVRFLPLDAPRGEALIMAGWQQAGVVSVAANPGQAYVTLWNNSVNAFWWFLVALIVTFALGMLALHFVLRPLKIVEQQAKAICDREYPVQNKLPWTLELRSVVVAMNRMTSKIKEMFEEQTAAIERLREESYRDALTGLANRAYFDMYLQQMTGSNEEIDTGALIFIELKGFKALNERLGYAAGDALLREAGHIIDDICKGSNVPEYIAAHLAGANFAVVLANVGSREASEIGERIAYALPLLRERGLLDTEEIGHVGIAMYQGQSQRQLLTEADMALRSAQAKGVNAVQMHVAEKADDQAVYTATHWTEFLSGVLKNNSILLHMQPVLDCADRKSVLQYEALLRIPGADGKLIPAGIFTPMAKRLGLIQKFDKLVVSEVLARLAAGRYGDTMIAVNLSPSTLQDTAFFTWLWEALAATPEAAKRIAFEVSEYGALEDPDRLRAIVLQVREHGAKFGIDHFGRGFSSFGYLATLKIDYLKIDGSYVRGIDQNKDNQFLVGSVAKIAHGLDLSVVAESVETDAEWLSLQTLGVNAVQGYGVGMPENI